MRKHVGICTPYVDAYFSICWFACGSHRWTTGEPEANQRRTRGEPEMNQRWTRNEPDEPEMNQKWTRNEQENRKVYNLLGKVRFWGKTRGEPEMNQKWTKMNQKCNQNEPEMNQKRTRGEPETNQRRTRGEPQVNHLQWFTTQKKSVQILVNPKYMFIIHLHLSWISVIGSSKCEASHILLNSICWGFPASTVLLQPQLAAQCLAQSRWFPILLQGWNTFAWKSRARCKLNSMMYHWGCKWVHKSNIYRYS